jgi:AbiV family abortive infection protein
MVDLDKEEIKKGINKCYNNSKLLLDDADLLLINNRFARAYSLYILCIEEIQKTNILFRILLEKENNKKFTEEDKIYYLKFFSSHIYKIKAAAVQNSYYNDFAKKYDLTIVKTPKEIRNEFNNPKQKDILKQYGFYVSLVHKKFEEPKDMIQTENCEKVKKEAKLSFVQLRHLRDMYFTSPDVFIRKFSNEDF